MRSTVSTVAAGLIGLWSLWALGDMQRQAMRQQQQATPAAVTAQATPTGSQQPIPNRRGLTYWPGP
jgi:hypothetical protein